jgi:hypothetical protein
MDFDMTLPHSNGPMLVSLFLAVAIQFVVAACFYPTLKLSRSKRAVVLVGLFAPIMLAPLLIQPEARALRLLAAVSAEILCVKLYDVNIGVMRGARPDLRTFLLFLPKWFSLVLRKLNVTSSRNRRKELPGVAKALAGLAAGAIALIVVFEVDWRAQPFAVEHSVKTLAFFFALFSYASVVAGLQRLDGGDIRDPAGTPFLSRTPADFWRRYHRVVQQFCYEDVFGPMGRRLSLVRATLITFALSAIFHEYVFSIAVGRV